jgi:hypothetical protein
LFAACASDEVSVQSGLDLLSEIGVRKSGVLLDLNAFGKISEVTQSTIIKYEIDLSYVHRWKCINNLIIGIGIETRERSLNHDVKPGNRRIRSF